MVTIDFIFIGVGGQIDFIRGAAMGKDGLGKPILAMPSTTNKGESKIVPFIKQGRFRCILFVYHLPTSYWHLLQIKCHVVISYNPLLTSLAMR